MDRERADVIVVYGSVNHPDGGVLVVNCFDIVFDRVYMEECGIVFAGEFKYGISAVDVGRS